MPRPPVPDPRGTDPSGAPLQAAQFQATRLHAERLASTKRAVGWIALVLGVPLWLLGDVFQALQQEQARLAESTLAEFLLELTDGGRATLGLFLLFGTFATWRMLAWRRRELERLATGEASRARRVPYFSLRFLPALLALSLVLGWVAQGWAAWWIATLELEVASTTLPHWATWIGWDTDAYAERLDVAATTVGWLFVGAAVASGLVAAFLANVDREQAPEARGLAAWYRLGTWYAALHAIALLVPRLVEVSWLGAERLAWIDPTLRGLETLLAIEIVLRVATAFWLRIYDGHEPPGARVVTDAFVPRLFGSHANPIKSVFDVAAESFGIDLRGTYALVFMRRALLPLAGLLLVCAWIASAFVVVPAHAVGVQQRFGARPGGDGVLEPGLHLVAPWPIDRVTLVETERVQTTPLGFESTIEGASMLWSEAHAEGEYRLVLGDGDELLSINAVVHWRPVDPIAYLFTVANPRQVLSDVAHRVLFENTVDRTLDDVLTGNLEALTNTFEEGIRAEVAARGLGIEIVDLVVYALHPPKDVAADYQAVVSNQIEGERLVIEAEADQVERVFGAEADAYEIVARADAERIGDEAAEVARIEAVERLAALRFGDERDALLDLLLYLDALEDALLGTPFVVWHRRLDEDGANLWILDR